MTELEVCQGVDLIFNKHGVNAKLWGISEQISNKMIDILEL